MKKLSFILLILITLGYIDCIKGETSSLPILDFPISARAIGMGEAFCAMGGDINSILFNPAGLSLVENKEVCISYSRFIDINYGFFGFTQPVGRIGAMGISATTLQVGDIEIYSFNKPSKTLKAQSDWVLTLSGGFRIRPNVSIGTNLKAIRSTIVEKSANAYAGDTGILIDIDKNLRLAGVIKNYGTKIKYKDIEDSLPLSSKIGASYKIYPSKKDIIATLSTDAVIFGVDESKINIGIECFVFTKEIEFYLRGGYRYGYDTNTFAFGIGLIDKRNHQLDYACLPDDNLGSIHQVSITRRF